MARPPKEIDERQVQLLAGCGCTSEEIASKLGCSKDTIERRFAASLEQGRNNGKTSLRGKQVELAMKGNVQMLIWLGKNMLGQKDRSAIDLNSITPEQALAILKADAGEDSGY